MGTVGIIVVYAVILGGMWFLLMRPQEKGAEENPGNAR